MSSLGAPDATRDGPDARDADLGTEIEARRKRGEHRFDTVRFHFIEAMARRAAAHQGEARRLLDGRLARLMAAYDADRESARAVEDGDAVPKAGAGASGHGPLKALVDHIARHAPPAATGEAPGPASPDLKAVRYFRSTWSKLSADRRLTQSQAKVPENPGPLNSHHLVHRSLTLMRDLSPEYLARFTAYVDALLWMDEARSGTPAATPRNDGGRKGGRGRSG